MKKLILPIVLGLLVITSASATEYTSNTLTSIEQSVNSLDTFFKAIKDGDYNSVKTLLESGQKVNEKQKGLTPLMFAARYNRHKIAKLLIGFGADMKAVSTNGIYTPLKMARLSKSKETYYVIKAALDKRAKVKRA